MPIHTKALMRPCRRHGKINGMSDGCYYCLRKYRLEMSSILSPEERILRAIFSEGRFYEVNTNKLRKKELTSTPKSV